MVVGVVGSRMRHWSVPLAVRVGDVGDVPVVSVHIVLDRLHAAVGQEDVVDAVGVLPVALLLVAKVDAVVSVIHLKRARNEVGSR